MDKKNPMAEHILEKIIEHPEGLTLKELAEWVDENFECFDSNAINLVSVTLQRLKQDDEVYRDSNTLKWRFNEALYDGGTNA